MRDPNIPDDAPIAFHLRSKMLGGDTPGTAAGPRTKTGRLASAGWRIVPIPNFWAKAELIHDGNGNGNPAFIDFTNPREWLVIPPDEAGLMARKFNGRRRAIGWAWAQAIAPEQRGGGEL